MKRPYSLRARTALFISAAFALLLALFALGSYVAIKHALIARADNEAKEQLQRILIELERGEKPDTTQIVNSHRAIGEAQLDVSIFSLRSDSTTLLWSTGATHNLSEDQRDQLIMGDGVALDLSAGDKRYRALSVVSAHHAVIATLDLVVIGEAEDAILRTFFILLLVGIGISSLLGYFIAGLSLAPIKLLIASARQLEASGSSAASGQLLVVPQKVAEVALLANALNRLIAERDTSIGKLQRFTADAAHELRTPLTVLKGELEVELRLTSPQDAAYAIYQSNLEEVERLIAIVQDLLLLANADASGQPSAKGSVTNVSHVAERVAQLLTSLAFARSIVLRTRIEPSLNVQAEPERLDRMIYNLVHNAVVYSEPEGEVMLELGLIEGRITLTITDHGSGISQEDLPHLFDRFYRAERARNRRSGGVGLGLAIVRSIADEYGYEIDVQSTLGVGTCIIVMLK